MGWFEMNPARTLARKDKRNGCLLLLGPVKTIKVQLRCGVKTKPQPPSIAPSKDDGSEHLVVRHWIVPGL